MHWGGGGGHGDHPEEVSNGMDGDRASVHPESVSWNCAESCCRRRAERSRLTPAETLNPGGDWHRRASLNGRALVLNLHFVLLGYLLKGAFLRKFLCAKVGHFTRSFRARPATRFFCFRYQRRKPTRLLFLSHHAPFFRGKLFFFF